MQKENQEKLQCPECESKNIRFRFKVNTKEKNNAYANLFKIMFENSFLIVMAMIRAKNKFKNQAK